MPELIAQGIQPLKRWRRNIPRDRRIVLGRISGTWSVPWDGKISREHINMMWNGQELEIEKIPTARNPIFSKGVQENKIKIKVGEHFVIGQTTFTLVDEQINVTLESPDPIKQQAYTAQYLQRVRFRNADQRIEVLSRLPEMICGAGSDSELYLSLVNMLLTGVPRAEVVALVTVDLESPEGQRVTPLQWDQRKITGGNLQPSEKLIVEAVSSEQSVLHVWNSAKDAQIFTAVENTDWAFCTPVGGKACQGWAIYISGSSAADYSSPIDAPSDQNDLRDDLKFTELVATTLRSLLELKILERRTTRLGQFFSPVVSKALTTQDPDIVLSPRETEVTVLFCDLRGFTRASEEASDDLMGLLNRVSKALGVTTRHILDQGGVVGDFQGDAVMGFWGWPLDQDDAVQRACLAALAIRNQFEAAARQSGNLLAGFKMGLGIATGTAVAGKIGTIDQVKVTVFGPVVNLASRLEGMTKIIRAPILVDPCTAETVRKTISKDLLRVRNVAIVRPVGCEASLMVSELLPSSAELSILSDQNIADYEAAVEAFVAGQWGEAFTLLDKVPTHDRVKDFLLVFIAQHNRTAPDNWDGVIQLTSKS